MGLTPHERARRAVSEWWGERSPEELPAYTALVAAVEREIRGALVGPCQRCGAVAELGWQDMGPNTGSPMHRGPFRFVAWCRACEEESLRLLSEEDRRLSDRVDELWQSARLLS